MSQALAQGGVDPTKLRTAWDELGQLKKKYGELHSPLGPRRTFIPVAGDAVRAGKIANKPNKLNDLRRALDTATAGLNRSLQRTREIAAKYWDDIAKKNRAAYEEAVKMQRCSRARSTATRRRMARTGRDVTSGQSPRAHGVLHGGARNERRRGAQGEPFTLAVPRTPS